MEPEITVALARVSAKAPLRALADVSLRCGGYEITIRRCAVFEKPGSPPWANLPKLSIEKNGKKQFVPIVDLSNELRKRVSAAVLHEYERKRDTK